MIWNNYRPQHTDDPNLKQKLGEAEKFFQQYHTWKVFKKVILFDIKNIYLFFGQLWAGIFQKCKKNLIIGVIFSSIKDEYKLVIVINNDSKELEDFYNNCLNFLN